MKSAPSENERRVTADNPLNQNTGGKAIMLGQWRIVLRQAEESARAGRLDEALALLSRSDVADHRLAIQLRGRFTKELVDRAGRRAQADDVSGAIADLALAEINGAPPDVLAAARSSLADRVESEIAASLTAGDPAKAIERVESFARHRVSGPALRRIREAAEAWQTALAEMRRGEFGQARDAIQKAARLAGDSASAAIAAVVREIDSRQQTVVPRIERLYAALSGSAWNEILAATEAVLDVVPEHPAARQARSRAWQQIGALSPGADLPRKPNAVALTPEPPAPAARPRPAPEEDEIVFITDVRGAEAPPPQARRQARGERFLLWADGIGGFLVCLGDQVMLGRASPDGLADVPLLGDLARQHALLTRQGDAYVIQARHKTYVNNREVTTAPLRHGDVIRLGPVVELEFQQPSPVSATARLVILSRHRLPVAVDGVLLMAETCLMGPSSQAHIKAPNLSAPVVIYRQADSLWCKAPGRFEVDGKPHSVRAALGDRSSVFGEGYSFSIEPLPTRSSRV